MGMSRSENMRHIRSKDTYPELVVRQTLRQLGYPGYRLHRKDLPGTPDIVFIGRRKVILIHGCFWHGHDCKEGARRPQSNQGYWLPKIDRNKKRDIDNLTKLTEHGWSVLIVWECELRYPVTLSAKLAAFMEN